LKRNIFISFSVNFSIHKIAQFTFKINNQLLKNYNETKIISKFQIKSNLTQNNLLIQEDYISRPIFFQIIGSEFIIPNSICYITEMNSLFQIYYPGIFINIFIWTTALIIVTILSLCKKNPLKSRGIFPFLSALMILFNSTDLIWPLVFDMEIISYFRCFLFYFIYHPLYMSITNLILLKTLRFMIHDWLQRNKSRLSNNQKNKFYRVVILLFKIISKW
jgi:hypothetical protein